MKERRQPVTGGYFPRMRRQTAQKTEMMILPVFSVAIIGLIRGAGGSQGYANPDGKFPNVSLDFLGQGAANIAASLPAGGSICGTALLMSAGARSRWANLLAGLFAAGVVMLAAPLVELVPMPSLAALRAKR